MFTSSLALLSALAAVRAQQVGTNTPEVHPQLTTSQCSSSGCTNADSQIVIDANWRWTHTTTGYTNCYTGNTWDATLCPDPTTCAQNCAVDGADYAATYGITTTGDSVRLDFVTNSQQKNVGSRIYLMSSNTEYEMFKLVNREFTFDVDVSNLPCGINGALYFTEMSADGGLSQYPTNKAGAQYGTGYCDAQCPQDIKFIDGLANVVNWTASATDPNSGTGNTGSCCTEMDIWEANSFATAFTPHPCSVNGQTACTGTDCGAGSARDESVCDHDGCDFNSWRMGNQSFFGPGLIVDSTKPVTVVTQFVTADGTDTGALSAIKRFYVQNGKVIPNSNVNFAGIDPVNDITDTFCTQQKTLFGDTNQYSAKGGLATMAKAFQQGMVLVMSIWDDHAAECLWLDSDYPTTADATKPGVSRGPCGTNTGVPAQIEASDPGAYVVFSNIRFGTIGSTTSGTSSSGGGGGGGGGTTTSSPPSGPTTTTSAPPPPSSSPPSGSGTVPHWGQCGGQGWTGGTACVAPYTCTFSNPWYSQCL